GDGGVGNRAEEGAGWLEGKAQLGGIAAEGVAVGVGVEGVGGEEDEERSENPENEEGGEVGAAVFRDPGDESDGEDEGENECGDVGGGEDPKNDGEKDDAGPGLVPGTLQSVGDSDSGVD